MLKVMFSVRNLVERGEVLQLLHRLELVWASPIDITYPSWPWPRTFWVIVPWGQWEQLYQFPMELVMGVETEHFCLFLEDPSRESEFVAILTACHARFERDTLPDLPGKIRFMVLFPSKEAVDECFDQLPWDIVDIDVGFVGFGS